MKTLTALVVACIVVACSGTSDEQAVFDDQLQTLDRARAVQDVADDRAEELERRIARDDESEPQ